MENHAPTFDVPVIGGVVYTPISEAASVNGMALQDDGSIVAVAAFVVQVPDAGPTLTALVRYTPEGALDTSFGDGGIAFPNTPLGDSVANGSDVFPRSVVIQPDGKIVAAANWGFGAGGVGLVRFNADGTQDPSFHGANPLVALGDFAMPYQGAWDMALQSDGKIVVVGTLLQNATDIAVTRFNTDGTLDTGFNGTGTATVDFGDGNRDRGYSVEVLPDGEILIGGTTGNPLGTGENSAFAFARLTSDGELDSTFGDSGRVRLSTVDAGITATASFANVPMALLPDGGFVAAGAVGYGDTLAVEVARFRADGTSDSSFAGTGFATCTVGDSARLRVGGVAVQGDGKIVVAASATGEGWADIVVMRYNVDGSVDSSFGHDGKAFTGLPFGGVNSLQIDSQGNILLGGFSTSYDPSLYGTGYAAVYRLLPDGYPDVTFNATTMPTLGGTMAYTENAAPVLLDPKASIWDADLSALADHEGNYDGASITLRRDGGADASDLFSAMGNLLFANGSAVLGGVVIGTVTNAAGQLTIAFNSNATTLRASAAIASIGYANSSEAPPASVKIDYTFIDGNTGAQGDGGALTATGSVTVMITAVNDAPVGNVMVTGLRVQGQQLTAHVNFTDADGIGAVGFQWQANGVDIPGATASTLLLGQAQVNKSVRVVASYIDEGGTHESIASQTYAIANVNDPPVGAVTITGAAAQGQTLVAGNTLSDADGLGPITYQWFTGATLLATGSFFPLGQAQVGKQIRVVASYRDGGLTQESVSSAATDSIANVNDAPVGGVTVSGNATQNQALTATVGVSDADGIPSATLQWQAGGVDIPGATQNTFVLTQAQVGKVVTAVYSYTDGYGTHENVVSNATLPVANVDDTPGGAVTISGTLLEGQTLTASNTLTDADGMGAVSYRWQANGVDIAGATAPGYTLTHADVNSTFRVVASYVDGGGTHEAVASMSTAPVESLDRAPVLDTGAAPRLPESAGPAGIRLSDLIADGSITDPDGPAVEAIAVTAVDTSLGAWQYSLDGGAHWLTMRADLIDSTTNELALLLGPDAMVRLVAAGDLHGSLDNALTFRAWDESVGQAGQYVDAGTWSPVTHAFSLETDGIAASVAAGNRAPTFQQASGALFEGSNVGVSLLPDGKIVFAGFVAAGPYTYDWYVRQLNADGSADLGFHGGQTLVADIAGDSNDFVDSFVVQADGKLVVAGHSSAGMVVARYNPDSSLDATFAGSGIALLGASDQQPGWFKAATMQPDGKILLAGYNYTANPTGADTELGLLRLNADGSRDSTFGAGGSAMLNISSGFDIIDSMEQQADGKIVVAGYTGAYNNVDFLVARFNGDGTLDTGFGADGWTVTDFGDNTSSYVLDEVIQPDGKILAVGTSGNAMAIARYNTDGTLDTGFNASGMVQTTFAGHRQSGASSVAVLPDGRILVAGWAVSDFNNQGEFVLARYNADGSPDTTFGIGGAIVGWTPAYLGGQPHLAVQPDGKIVVTDSGTVRFNADGSVDPTFGAHVDTLGDTPWLFQATGAPIVLDSTVAVNDPDLAALAGGAGNYAGASITLQRHGEADAHDGFVGTGSLIFSGGNAVLAGVMVGTVSNNAGQLVIAFNANATQARVDQVLSSIGYSNSDVIASAADIAIDYTFNDGNTGAAQGTGGALTASGTTTVHVVGAPPPANLVLTGTATGDWLSGDRGQDSLTGLAGNDTLSGAAGNDTLNGGSGNDRMDGGEGSDLYLVGASEHGVAEIADSGVSGIDEVRFTAASGTLTLFAGDTGIERVVLGTGTDAVPNTSATTKLSVVASAAPNGLTIIGNAGANTLTGTAFADTIDGGAGADKMTGGNGGDTYVVDNASDAITEANTLAGGVDIAIASVTYTLPANVENLVLAGGGAINGTGNASANTITGNAAANLLDGKAGIDRLDGGEGGDIYFIGLAADHPAAEIADSGVSGVDEVRFGSTKASTLTLFAQDVGFERVVIGTGTGATAVTTGTGALNVDASAVLHALAMIGNAGANTLRGTAFDDTLGGGAGTDSLFGNAGDDTLAGGAGNDTLTGGDGNDVFVFDTATSRNIDTITDFAPGADVLQLAKAIFTAIPDAAGTLAEARFWSGAGVVKGHDADDRIVYNTTTGALYYDPDGSGSTAAVQVAVIGTAVHPVLAASDFVLA